MSRYKLDLENVDLEEYFFIPKAIFKTSENK